MPGYRDTESPRLDRYLDAAYLTGALLQGAADDAFVEVRSISANGRVVQEFHRVEVLRRRRWAVPDLGRQDGRANVYYGVIPRVRQRGGGADCGPALAVWADYDHGIPTSLPLEPSIVVQSSPGKHQALWLLEKPCHDLGSIEALNRSIAETTGADLNACDRARVLRLPGLANLKYPGRPQARLAVYEPERRYRTETLEAAWPPAAPALAYQLHRPDRSPPTWLGLVFEAIVGYLHTGGFRPRPARDGGVVARCPMHDDENPSLSCHPTRGWRCWAGCGEGRLTLLAHRLGVRVISEAV